MTASHRHRCGMVGVMLGTLLGSAALHAHPHHWIDVFTEWQFDADGRINGVKIRWLFDDYYSVLLADDAAAAGEELQSVLSRVLDNTAKHNYFIRAEQQGVEAEFGNAEHGRIDVQDHRIKIEFRLPMVKLMDPMKSGITYQVAEPTYWFEMLHAEEGPAIVLKDAPETCGYHLEPPRPDAALVAYAASLGINESGGDDLGIQFAETVTIRCG